jgi:ABC-2 type transport system permease protein
MREAFVVSGRILRSVRGDPRTLALVLVVPAVIVYLFSEVFADPVSVAPVLLATFVFVFTYVLTAIGFLRERQSGTLERVLVSPISRLSLVLGYVTGYGILATVQSLVLLGASIYFLDLTFEHGVTLFIVVELLGALSALGIGILLSLFANSEFQALQFIPLVISPQILLGGTFLPVEDLPIYLELPARAMPMTYVIQAMNYVVLDVGTVDDLWIAAAALVLFSELSILAADALIRRNE